MYMTKEKILTSLKFSNTDHHYLYSHIIVVISLLKLVSRLTFAVAVLFHLTNIKKLITNI